VLKGLEASRLYGGRCLYYPLGYKPALDGLRAFAIMPVLLLHGRILGFQWGYVGVDLFFVISGYLITTVLLREYLKTGRISFTGFYRRRALRLFPALAVLCLAFLLYAAIVLRNLPEGLEDVLVVVFYIGNWTRAFSLALPRYLGHTWSLAVEEQFYMLWPALLLAILALSSNATSALRFILALIVVVTCWRAMLVFTGAGPDRLYNGTDTRADALLIGAALSLAFATSPSMKRLALLSRYLWLPAAVVIVALPTLFSPDGQYMLLGGFSVIALAAATILTATLDGGLLSRILSNSAFVWIGQRSYGLYLWHYPIMLAGRLDPHLPQGRKLTLIEIACAFVFASLSYKFIERPFLERRYENGSMETTVPAQQNSN
jgi:peptidoglycan/LPS O-acetylase OafA/YrhL